MILLSTNTVIMPIAFVQFQLTVEVRLRHIQHSILVFWCKIIYNKFAKTKQIHKNISIYKIFL